MRRPIEALLLSHFRSNRQMVLLSGPRQVGKTTVARSIAAVEAAFPRSLYLNWDNLDHRADILAGPTRLAAMIGARQLAPTRPLLVLDEVHKYPRWRTLLKGFFDTYGEQVAVLVTGSAHLDVYRAGGDSLMGRYFSYRLHPLSIAEIAAIDRGNGDWAGEPGRRTPERPAPETADRLLRFGGFPEPFLRADPRFANRWKRLRHDQLFREDLRDLTRIREVAQVETLAALLATRVGQLVSYASLANAVDASIDSVRRWLDTLRSLYYCFVVRPWHQNVARALRKEPKYYLWDWSLVADRGARIENLVASALLKAAHLWTDDGYGDFGLYFVRDKQKREVDFLVARDGVPWFLVEAKATGDGVPSASLRRFQRQTAARHAFQGAWSLPFVDRDCFTETEPVEVPVSTLVAQLV